jgi:hypothetical protein
VFIVRGIAVMSLLFLQNCAKNMELGPDGLGGAQTLSASQYSLLASAAPNYHGTIGGFPRHIPKKDAQPSSFDGKSHLVRLQDRRDSENSNAEMLPQPVHASMGVPPPDDALPPGSNSKFLELLGEEDTENQMLKRKTMICRGC